MCATTATAVARFIESSVVRELIAPNLITIVIALLAINVQTTSVVAVKLRELSDKHGINFSRSIKQFIYSLYEQAVLVILSLVISGFIKSESELISSVILEFATFFVFSAALHIFFDTAISLFDCLFEREH